MKTNGRIIISTLVIVAFFSFLGIPVPDWLSGFVSSLAGFIAAIVAGFSNLMAFVQLFVHF
jgi:hypothetical protein